MNSKVVEQKVFWTSYLAILLSYITNRILIQTDLIMVSGMGAEYTAAFSVPSRIMIVDTIFAMAVAPVISIAVSKENNLLKRNKIIASSLSFTFFVSAILLGIGLFLYPLIAAYAIKDQSILYIAKDAIYLMTLGAPIRVMAFVTAMILFSQKKGKQLSYIYILTIVANYFFNLYFININGFVGVYISTIIVSSLQLFWSLYLIKKLIKKIPFSIFDFFWIKKIGARIGSEWLRITSLLGAEIIIIYLLSLNNEWFLFFSVFGITSEFSLLITMPLLALLRCAAMQSASVSKNNSVFYAWQALRPIKRSVILASLFASIFLILLGDSIGEKLYFLSGKRLEMWGIFIVTYAVMLPLYSYSTLQRACFQANEKSNQLTKLDMLSTWFFICTFYMGFFS